MLCGVMLAADKEKQADRLLATIKDPKKRANMGLIICVSLSSEGKFDAAIRRAQSLPAERRKGPSGEDLWSDRTGVLFTVARFQSSAYAFADAKKTIKLINDPEGISHAYNRLAESQAKAGLYAEAEESLKKFVTANEDDKHAKEQTRQLIASYKAEGRKDPPRKLHGLYFKGLRLASTIFSDSGAKLDNLAVAEKAEQIAEKAQGALEKARMWREIAWAYYDMRDADKKNLERCRRAIEKSIQNAEKIPDGLGQSYMRALAFSSAADLYLELGETDLAKQMVKKADAVNLAEDMLGGLSSFTTTPMLIAVLVRVGDVDGALAIAEKMQKATDKKTESTFPTEPDIAWLTWATVCTLEGKVAYVERQLERSKNTRVNAILCAGVAGGLLELQKQQ